MLSTVAWNPPTEYNNCSRSRTVFDVIRKSLVIGLLATAASLVIGARVKGVACLVARGCVEFEWGREYGFPLQYVQERNSAGGVTDWSVSKSALAFTLGFWTAPALFVLGIARARRLTKRSNEGRCSTCGYDLTGLPRPRCPECGRVNVPGEA